MSYELRRFTVRECLGKAFNILFDDFWAFLSIGFLLGLAYFGLQQGLASYSIRITSGSGNPTIAGVLISIVSAMGVMFLHELFQGLVSRLVSNRYMDVPGTWRGISRTLARAPLLIVASFLTSLAFTGGMILLVVPGIIFGLGFAFTSMIIVVEELGPIAAMKRSWKLTKGKRWRILGLELLVGLIGLGVNTGFGWLLGVLWPVAGGAGMVFFRTLVVLTVPYMVVGSYSAAVIVIFYLGIRASEEGLEAERIAGTFGSAPNPTEFRLGDDATKTKE